MPHSLLFSCEKNRGTLEGPTVYEFYSILGYFNPGGHASLLELCHHQYLDEVKWIYVFPQFIKSPITGMKQNVNKKFQPKKFFLTKGKDSAKQQQK